jgi:DNA replication ATP-dependent helicase Dna2
MNRLSANKSEEFLSSLELISISPMKSNVQLIALSKLFYRLIKSATNEEGLAFRNFYARFRYLLSRLPLSEDGRTNLDAFRRFVKEGGGKRVNTHTMQQGIALLKDLVRLIAGQAISEEAAIGNDSFSRLFPRRNYEVLKNLKVLCSSWTEIRYNEGRAYFILDAFDLDNLQGQVEIYIRQHLHYDYTAIKKWLAENAVLMLQNISFNASMPGNKYETTFDSLITLEPDFLLEATAIGECFTSGGSNSDIFFLSRLVTDLPGSAALKGSIVGYYLDELVRQKITDRDQVYLTAQRNNALKAAQFGKQEMQGLKHSIYTEHLPNIESFVRRDVAGDLWIEPTYLSTEYGLQGRIDLLSRDKDANTIDIIELKSGNPSNPIFSIAWPNHKMQVVCYDMMLESTYGKGRQGSNAIFYSKCTVLPYRNLVSEHVEKREALSIRNEIVANIYKLAVRDFTPLQNIIEEGIPALPRFHESALMAFQQGYAPDRIATIYYQEMIAFLLRELVNAKVGDQLKEEEDDRVNGFAGLWLNSLSEKEQDFRVLYDLEVMNKKNIETGNILLSIRKEIAHSFRKSDLVVMYPETNGKYDPLHQHMLKGSVKEIHRDRLIISLFNQQTDYSFIHDHDKWAIEPDIFERNYWSGISCLFNWLNATNRKQQLLFGNEQPLFSQEQVYFNERLTPTQTAAVQNALDAEDYYILQGPPGTGKTRTFLVNYVKESLRSTKCPIVVLAFTNKAVEKIGSAFRTPLTGTPIPYLRLGSQYVDDDSLFSEQLRDDDPDNWRQIIDSHRVFVSTVTTFQNNWLLLKKFIPFTQVIIDEASQLTEATISGILALFNKFILIGDHKQLPAVITQDKKMCKIENPYLNELGINNLSTSLFERLTNNAKSKGWKNAYGQLRDHYRMHQDIAALIAENYPDGLVTGTPEQISTVTPYPLPKDSSFHFLNQHRVIFIESPPGKGFKKNEAEAHLAANIANILFNQCNLPPSEIGIITPFRAQIAAIKEHLCSELLDDETFIVDTVERFQGDERKVIIFSTTITNARQLPSIQSILPDAISTDRKLLVSISRASEQFIILGNKDALKGSEIYRDLITRIEEFTSS